MTNIQLKKADVNQREAVKTFHIPNHLNISVSNETERKIQTDDLETDFPQLYDDKLFSEGITWILIDVNDNSIKGCVSIFPTKNSSIGYLNNFSVDENIRGKGFGNLLFETALEFAEKNYKTIQLITLPNRMKTALKVYKKNDFVLIEEMKEGPYVVWKMEKAF